MENDQQTPVITPTDEFVSFFASKGRATLHGVLSALALLQRALGRKHKWYAEDPDVFSITVKSLESLISKRYVKTFLNLSCITVSKGYQNGVATRPYRLRGGFDAEEAYMRLSEILGQKASGKKPLWKQLKHAPAAHVPVEKLSHHPAPLPSSHNANNITRSNAFVPSAEMKWYDVALINAFPGSISYRRAGSSKQGRRYHPLQSVSRAGKTLALRGTGLVDIDIAKCHPTILHQLTGSRSPALYAYLSRPHPRCIKDDVNAVIHGRKVAHTQMGERLLLEMSMLRKILINRGLTTEEELGEKGGMFKVLTRVEDRILSAMEDALARLNREVHLLTFDGLICEAVSSPHLRWIEGEVAANTGFFINLNVKQIF